MKIKFLNHSYLLLDRKHIVELLVQHGADIAAKDNYGKTALDLARDRSICSSLFQWCNKHLKN